MTPQSDTRRVVGTTVSAAYVRRRPLICMIIRSVWIFSILNDLRKPTNQVRDEMSGYICRTHHWKKLVLWCNCVLLAYWDLHGCVIVCYVKIKYLTLALSCFYTNSTWEMSEVLDTWTHLWAVLHTSSEGDISGATSGDAAYVMFCSIMC